MVKDVIEEDAPLNVAIEKLTELTEEATDPAALGYAA